MPDRKYYEITKNSDSIEGRGVTMTTGIYFWKKSDALAFVESYRYASRFGIMGTRGNEYDIREKTTRLPTIYESLEEYDEANPDPETLKKLKAQALAKLTAAERKALKL
jgi:hypothetical protein